MTKPSFRELFEGAQRGLPYLTDGAILDFTEELCRVMEIEEVSRGELARRLATSPAYVTKILRGRTNFTLASMVRVAQALGCELRVHLAPAKSTTRWLDVHSSPAASSVTSVTTRLSPAMAHDASLIEVA